MRALILLPLVIALAGCTDDPSPMCPVATDPKVRYVENSDRDPRVCETIRFTCAEGAPFSNECGCGCIIP